MAAETLPLFDARTMSIDEKVNYFERMMQQKSVDHACSFGDFKSKTLHTTYSASIIFHDNSGKHHVWFLEGKSYSDLYTKAIEQLEKVKP